ncbi:MAG: glycosyltransferase [Acetobacter persici]
MPQSPSTPAGHTPCTVAAVIVTCNRLAMLKTVLGHTLAQKFSAVVVVNNASQDGTQDWLETQTDPRLHCLHETVNSGGAGGFARGMEYAAHHTDCEWMVCFDDDAWPQPDALSVFQSLPLPPAVGGVAAAVYFPGGAVCDMNRPGLNPFTSGRGLLRLLKSRKPTFAIDPSSYRQSKPLPVDYASFVGFFVRSDLVRGPLGLPQTDLFIYADDTLYAWKLRCLGRKILFVPAVRFNHDCKTTVSFARNRWKIYYIVRNRILFYKKIAGSLFLPFAPLLLLSILKLYWKNRTVPHIRPLMLAGLRDGFRNDTSRKHPSIVTLAGES